MTNDKQLSNLKEWENARMDRISERKGETLKTMRERVESEGFDGL